MEFKALPPMQSVYQSSILKSVLNDEEIPFFVKNENLSSVMFDLPDFQEIIQVKEEDYYKAIEIIKRGFPEVKID